MKIKIWYLATLVFSSIFVFVPQLAQADFNCTSFYNSFNITEKNVNVVSGLPQICSFEQAATVAITWLLWAVGTVSLIFIMLGGFWIITASGNEEQAEKGRKALTNAVIGLAVVILAGAIVRVVVSSLNSAPPQATPNTSTSPGGTPNSNASPGTTPATANTNSPSATPPASNKSVLIQYATFQLSNTNQVTFQFDAQGQQDALKQIDLICGTNDKVMTGYVNNTQYGPMVLNNGAAIISTKTAVAANDLLMISICGTAVNTKSVSTQDLTIPANPRSN